MRPLESTGALFIVFYILWALLGRQQTTITRTLPVAASVFLLLHLIVEKYRWQMIPLYILALLFGLLVILNRPFDPPRWLAITATIALIPAVALPILLPVPNVPRASGAYQVGTTIYTLTDESRAEIYSGQDEARRFKIQIWYPSKPRPSDKPAPWIARADIFSPAISDLLKLPPFFLDHLALVQTPALQDAPIAPSSTQYPLIVFSHGWKGFAAQNTVQAIQLASHGYVVVALQHTYGAVTTVFDDGTIAPNNPDALPDGEPDEIYDTAARKLANQWAGDISYALDFLAGEDQDTNSPFHKALDLTRIGVYGHSTGGGAAIQFCGTDSRCKALLGMDPFMRPVSLEVLASGTPQPSFFMFSQGWIADMGNSKSNNLFHKFLIHDANNMGVLTIEGAKHYDFSDLPMLSPIASQLGLKGPINGQRVTTIVNDYLLSFFDLTLRGQETTLFNGPSPKYPETQFSH